MKKIILIAAAAIMLFGCGKKSAYTITGDIKGLSGTITLMDEKGENVAEVPVTDGKFTIEGVAEEPSLGLLANDNQPIAMLFLEPGNISVTGDTQQSITISGTKANDNNAIFTEKQYAIMEGFFTAASEEERQAVADELKSYIETTMTENLDNYFGLYLLTNIISSMDGDEIIAWLDKFDDAVRNTTLAQEVRAHAEAMNNTSVGSKFIDITLPDADGNEIALSSLVGEGKYVLLDFWASWCMPCIRELPFLVKTYELYHDKGFEIYGVSLDRDIESWITAMKDNAMTWPNVSIIDNEEQTATTDYAVQSIPANFLIDPDGNIIAKNLRGEEVQTKIAELLGK